MTSWLLDALGMPGLAPTVAAAENVDELESGLSHSWKGHRGKEMHLVKGEEELPSRKTQRELSIKGGHYERLRSLGLLGGAA